MNSQYHYHHHPQSQSQQHQSQLSHQNYHNQPLYGNITNDNLNNDNNVNNHNNFNQNNGDNINDRSNSLASYKSRQSSGQLNLVSQSSSVSSIPTANSNVDIDSSIYRGPLSDRRESINSSSGQIQSNRVSPSVCIYRFAILTLISY